MFGLSQLMGHTNFTFDVGVCTFCVRHRDNCAECNRSNRSIRKLVYARTDCLLRRTQQPAIYHLFGAINDGLTKLSEATVQTVTASNICLLDEAEKI